MATATPGAHGFDLRRLAVDTGTEGSVVTVALSRKTSSAKLLALLLRDPTGELGVFANTFGAASERVAVAAGGERSSGERGSGGAAPRAPLRQLFRRRRGNRAGMIQIAEDDSESAIELRDRNAGESTGRNS